VLDGAVLPNELGERTGALVADVVVPLTCGSRCHWQLTATIAADVRKPCASKVVGDIARRTAGRVEGAPKVELSDMLVVLQGRGQRHGTGITDAVLEQMNACQRRSAHSARSANACSMNCCRHAVKERLPAVVAACRMLCCTTHKLTSGAPRMPRLWRRRRQCHCSPNSTMTPAGARQQTNGKSARSRSWRIAASQLIW
jgi:hypothetical protein